MFHAGTRLGDRYVLVEPIARGGMGEVWRADDTMLGRIVAVKVLLPGLVGDQEFAERFRVEARAMASLSDPNIVEVYDYGHANGAAYLVMQLVPGEPLHALLRRVGPLPPHRAMTLVAQAARALHLAHGKGIVHRDVKPGNLLIRPDGRLVLTDFGIARSPTAERLTAPDEVLGTPSYLAPEQVVGHPVGPETDVYALGVVAYECLTLSPPFLGDTPIAIALKHVHEEPPPLPPAVPEAVRIVVMRALAKDPRQRWASAAAMALAAAAAAHPSALPVRVRPGSPDDDTTAMRTSARMRFAGTPTPPISAPPGPGRPVSAPPMGVPRVSAPPAPPRVTSPPIVAGQPSARMTMSRMPTPPIGVRPAPDQRRRPPRRPLPTGLPSRQVAWVAASIVVLLSLVGWIGFKTLPWVGDAEAAGPRATSPTGAGYGGGGAAGTASAGPSPSATPSPTPKPAPAAITPAAQTTTVPAVQPPATTTTTTPAAPRTPGPNERVVPNVLGRYEMEVYYMLGGVQLQPQIEYKISANSCRIVGQNPVADSIVPVNSTVIVTVDGPDPSCQPL